jgi:hypothetical protein
MAVLPELVVTDGFEASVSALEHEHSKAKTHEPRSSSPAPTLAGVSSNASIELSG